MCSFCQLPFSMLNLQTLSMQFSDCVTCYGGHLKVSYLLFANQCVCACIIWHSSLLITRGAKAGNQLQSVIDMFAGYSSLSTIVVGHDRSILT